MQSLTPEEDLRFSGSTAQIKDFGEYCKDSQGLYTKFISVAPSATLHVLGLILYDLSLNVL